MARRQASAVSWGPLSGPDVAVAAAVGAARVAVGGVDAAAGVATAPSRTDEASTSRAIDEAMAARVRCTDGAGRETGGGVIVTEVLRFIDMTATSPQ